MSKARVSSPDLHQLVDALYGGLAEDMRLEASLRVLLPVFRTRVAGINFNDFPARLARYPVIVGDVDQASLAAMAHEYELRAGPAENLWSTRSEKGYLAQGYQYSEAVASDAELLASPYYQHYLKPAGVRYGMGICLRGDACGKFTVVSLNRAPSAGPFGSHEFAIVGQIRGHLANIYSISKRLSMLEEEVRSLRACFDQNPVATVLLDSEGRIIESNARMESLLDGARQIERSACGFLRVRQSEGNARLRQALTRVGTTGSPGPEAVLLSRPGQSPPGGLVLHLCGLPPQAADTLAKGGRILGFVYALDQTGNDKINHGILLCTLRLTETEANVALSLRRCHDVEQIALEMSVAVNTVRMHLKHLYAKTGASKQSELVGLIDKILCVAPD